MVFSARARCRGPPPHPPASAAQAGAAADVMSGLVTDGLGPRIPLEETAYANRPVRQFRGSSLALGTRPRQKHAAAKRPESGIYGGNADKEIFTTRNVARLRPTPELQPLDGGVSDEHGGGRWIVGRRLGGVVDGGGDGVPGANRRRFIRNTLTPEPFAGFLPEPVELRSSLEYHVACREHVRRAWAACFMLRRKVYPNCR